jgi:TfoX/Sxy family transcriptional regulator of competence genes
MAYDEGLAGQIRTLLDGEHGVTEKKMFGGVAFLLDGKMFVGIVKDDLMVRVGQDNNDQALKQPHTRPMDFTEKPMVGYVFVSPDGLSEDAVLERWVRMGLSFVATLPEKKKGSAKKREAGKRSK